MNFEYIKNKKVLNNINLKIEKNKIVGILGNSGSGKTTLINLLAQLLDLHSGEITIYGKKLKTQMIKENFKILFQLHHKILYLMAA